MWRQGNEETEQGGDVAMWRGSEVEIWRCGDARSAGDAVTPGLQRRRVPRGSADRGRTREQNGEVALAASIRQAEHGADVRFGQPARDVSA
jgi:hypothetical protein